MSTGNRMMSPSFRVFNRSAVRAVAAVAVFASSGLFADGLSPQTRRKCETALANGARYLMSIQNENGSFGKVAHPALAGLGAMGLHDVDGLNAQRRDQAIARAMDYVIKYVPFPGGKELKERDYYPNYTASVALLAMATVDKPEYIPHMRRARQYLQDLQFDDAGMVDYGGIGYGKTGRADLSNTSWAVRALKATDFLDKEPQPTTPKQREEMGQTYECMAEFLTKVQNLPETNEEPYVSEHPDDRGGFFYRPHESKAGERETDDDQKTKSLISSGSMTYAGLLSMVYCDLSRDDVRVRAALDYARRHYTVDENPAKGMEGYFFYLHIMSKALNACGEGDLTLADGTKANWREDVAAKLLALQNDDGSWKNEEGRFMEAVPTLATAYSLVTLKNVMGTAQGE